MDYSDPGKHGIGGWIMVRPSKQGIGVWIMVKPSNMEWRVDVREPGVMRCSGLDCEVSD